VGDTGPTGPDLTSLPLQPFSREYEAFEARVPRWTLFRRGEEVALQTKFLPTMIQFVDAYDAAQRSTEILSGTVYYRGSGPGWDLVQESASEWSLSDAVLDLLEQYDDDTWSAVLKAHFPYSTTLVIRFVDNDYVTLNLNSGVYYLVIRRTYSSNPKGVEYEFAAEVYDGMFIWIQAERKAYLDPPFSRLFSIQTDHGVTWSTGVVFSGAETLQSSDFIGYADVRPRYYKWRNARLEMTSP